MRVFKNTQEASGKIKNAVVTTGTFDGVHVGHKVIIDRLKQLAEEIGGESTLVTFYPHPRKVLYPDQKDLRLINSQEEKIELLSKTGLENLVIIPFSVEFSKTTGHDFITDILIGNLNAKIIIVGQNHHFGYNRSGDFSYLDKLSRELDFKVEDIPLKDIENETVSSTKIRNALTQGNIMRANAYLDHQYIITGTMKNSVELKGIDSSGYFSVEIEEEEKLVPPPGVYATNILLNADSLKSMTVITEKEGQRIVNNTLIYDKINIIDKRATLYFYKKIKGPEILMDGMIDSSEIEDAREDVDELLY
ncbi:MAG: riboflavin biosynthesis protein RibF [Bacteroidetes bacterium]|nr:MAG: riboflavin biosynthesis protein RibF [Bacteroidota bacterium]